MKTRSFILLPALLGTFCLSSVAADEPVQNRIPVAGRTHRIRNVAELREAAAVVQAGDEIIIAPGEYRDVMVRFEKEGDSNRKIRIRAEEPGTVVLAGTTAISLFGDHYVIEGLCFKDGNWDKKLCLPYSPTGRPAVILVLADHTRITQCVFETSHVDRPIHYISSDLGPKGYPQYTRIDHCSFVVDDRIANGQFIAFNNSSAWTHHALQGRFGDEVKRYFSSPQLLAETGQPLYSRVDHCYFGIYGGSVIRWGFTGDSMTIPGEPQVYGRFPNPFPESLQGKKIRVWGGCIFDSNLVEGQRSGDGERVVSKLGQNLFLNNTFYNDSGQLSLRGGSRELVIGNYFIRDDRYKRLRGQTANNVMAWSSEHVIANNYFRIFGASGLGLNSGYEGRDTGQDTVTDSIIAYNVFETQSNRSSSVRLHDASRDRRPGTLRLPQKSTPEKESKETIERKVALVHGNVFKGNLFVHPETEEATGHVFSFLYDRIIKENRWEDNLYRGNALGYLYHFKDDWKEFRINNPTANFARAYVEGVEKSDQVVEEIEGVRRASEDEFHRDAAGYVRARGIVRERLEIKTLETLPFDIVSLVERRIVPIDEDVFPEAHKMDMSDFGDRIGHDKPLLPSDVGARWLREKQKEISRVVRYRE